MATTQTVTETYEYDEEGRVTKKTTVTTEQEDHGPKQWTPQGGITTPQRPTWPQHPATWSSHPAGKGILHDVTKDRVTRPRVWLFNGGLQDSLDRD